MTFKNVFMTSLILALIASLALNYFFYKRAFIPLQLTKLDPIGLDYYSPEPLENNAKEEKSVMFYGDSRGLSWPAPKLDGYHFNNRSIGNQTSIQIAQRFNTHVIPHKPQLIVVQMCVNDLKMIPLFPDKKDRIIQDCKNNIQFLLDKAKQSKAKTILTTVFPLGDVSMLRKGMGIKEDPIIDGIEQINNFIVSQASDTTFIFDSYKLLIGENRKIIPEYSHDWLHLNSTGYEYLNREFVQFLSQTFEQE